MEDLLREYKEKVLDAHKPQPQYNSIKPGIQIWEERDPLTMNTILTASAMVMGQRCYTRVIIPDRELMYNAEDAYRVARERLVRQLEDYMIQQIEKSTRETIEVRDGRGNIVMTYRR